ncbi:right-handed parallel beta-helix repeat-containing protein [Pseudoclavibacter sp. 13-3]|uniref:right-handed parallel beta-helix repeat-containing protein n=1 Tax=Pseudoclavibacter sp. 13-3 TaxID=2901228 RepID=UPI001E53FFBC|nr:right-handed parallel beta-helix repeat-containing protein [Pseudoclavibacter sp. 13-3]MCD7101122.1 right-handed parallel beta-helix repeat-containing protein [Pseudoclavibacter sp. 13-3]
MPHNALTVGLVTLSRMSVIVGTALFAVALAGCATGTTPKDAVVEVTPDSGSLQDAADRVAEGGTIVLGAGTYRDSMTIRTRDVTVRGSDRNETIIDGEGQRPLGIVGIADGVRVENLTVTGATLYGVLVTGTHDENSADVTGISGYEQFDPEKFPAVQRFSIDHVTAYNNGLYGIYAFNAKNGAIRDSYASGSADSGFYVGQCQQCNIAVTGNVAERNAVGFENANASDSLVITGNRFTDNRVGMTLLSNYQEAFTPQHGNVVAGNVISDNQTSQSPSQADGGFGTGIGISGGQDNTITANRIENNARSAVIFASTEDLPSTGNRLIDNLISGSPVTAANISAGRAPASANCLSPAGAALPTGFAAELARACDGEKIQQSSASADQLPGPSAPAGMSFLEVPAPRQQPQMGDPGTSRDPLPDNPQLPDATGIAVPDAGLLVALTGVR